MINSVNHVHGITHRYSQSRPNFQAPQKECKSFEVNNISYFSRISSMPDTEQAPQNNCNTSAVSTTPSSNYVSRSGHQYEWKKERLGRSLVVFSFNGRKVKTIFCNHYLTLAGKVSAQACGPSSVAPSCTHISVSALHVFH